MLRFDTSLIHISLLITVFSTYLGTGFSAEAATEKVCFQQVWDPENDDDGGYSVQIIQVEDPREAHSYKLKVLKKKQSVFTQLEYDETLGLFPYSMYCLHDGNLATLWVTGIGGYCHLIVFTVLHGKVKQVLHDSSKLTPEFVYSSKGNIMGHAGDSPNSFKKQSIIIGKAEWTKNEYLPTTASIYTWDAEKHKYEVRKSVPWNKRLLNL